MEISWMFVTPVIVFLVFVAPLWVVMHYRTKARKSGGLTVEQYERLRQLEAELSAMEERIRALETILDEEAPQWRQSHEQ
jgi:phage shock protein B